MRVLNRLDPENWTNAIAALKLINEALRVAKLFDEEPDLFTTEQAALYLNISRKTVRNLTTAGKLNRTKRGRGGLYTREELDRFLKTAPKKTRRTRTTHA
jgi:excisionase family DNA binding protein